MTKKEIDKRIADTCIEIIQEPLLYFSEADIQQLLAESLRKIDEIRDYYETSVHKGKGSKSFYKTGLLHREYGGGGGTRIDIVVFEEEEVAQIDRVNLQKNNGRYYLQPRFAFELGTEKTVDTSTHFNNDLKKLSNAKETGYLIHIFKDVTQARSNTKTRENTEDKIERDFKSVFENANANTIPNNVKILAILLRTYRNQKRMRGKCEIFNRRNGNWEQVNITKKDDLKKAIIAQLI